MHLDLRLEPLVADPATISVLRLKRANYETDPAKPTILGHLGDRRCMFPRLPQDELAW